MGIPIQSKTKLTNALPSSSKELISQMKKGNKNGQDTNLQGMYMISSFQSTSKASIPLSTSSLLQKSSNFCQAIFFISNPQRGEENENENKKTVPFYAASHL
jgi:hypothetical protein